MFRKSTAYSFLLIATLPSVLLIISRPVPQFNYDFETFFPQNDEDLDFYKSFKSQFENDNYYLLVALGNDEGELLTHNFFDKSQLHTN